MAKVTHVGGVPAGEATEFTSRSGRVFMLRQLNGYDLMMIDDLAVSPEGNLRVMRIAYLRALASIVGVKNDEGTVAPFGPLRTDIDVQKWAQTLSAVEMDDLQSEYNRRNNPKSDTNLKNE